MLDSMDSLIIYFYFRAHFMLFGCFTGVLTSSRKRFLVGVFLNHRKKRGSVLEVCSHSLIFIVYKLMKELSLQAL